MYLRERGEETVVRRSSAEDVYDKQINRKFLNGIVECRMATIEGLTRKFPLLLWKHACHLLVDTLLTQNRQPENIEDQP